MAGAVYSDPLSQALSGASRTVETGMGLVNRNKLTANAEKRTENDQMRIEAATEVAMREMKLFEEQMDAEKQAMAASAAIDQDIGRQHLEALQQGSQMWQAGEDQARVEADLTMIDGIISEAYPNAPKEKRAEMNDALARRAQAQKDGQLAGALYRRLHEVAKTSPDIDQGRLEQIGLAVQEWLQSAGKEGTPPSEALDELNELREADDDFQIRKDQGEAFLGSIKMDGVSAEGQSFLGAVSRSIRDGDMTLEEGYTAWADSDEHPEAKAIQANKRQAEERAAVQTEQRLFEASAAFEEIKGMDFSDAEGFATYMEAFEKWRSVPSKLKAREQERQAEAKRVEYDAGFLARGAANVAKGKAGGKKSTAKPGPDEPKMLSVPKRRKKEKLEAYVQRLMDSNVPTAEIEAIVAREK